MAEEELIDGMSVDLSGLPEELRPLLPYLREWSIGDDVERSEKLGAASTEELLAFFQAAWPKLDAINARLDATMDMTPCPDDAMVLLPFGQCIGEVRLLLEERTGTDPAAG